MDSQPPNNVRLLATNADAASDRAIEWLAHLRGPEVSAIDHAEFALWLSASPANAQAFDEASALWHFTGIAQFEEPVPRPQSPWLSLAAAASVLIIALVTVIELTPQQFTTGKGEQRRVVLQDGSVAHLNTQTAIAVSYGSTRREIELIQGEAWFDVQSNPARPFIVQGDYASARAIGTAFAVRDTDSATIVGVSEGLVAVESPFNRLPVELAVGQGSLVGARESKTLSFDPNVALAWRRGQLIYQDIALEDLLTDLNRYLPTTMTLNDDTLAQVQVSAVLFLDDQQAMLEALVTTLPVKWTKVADDLIILSKI